MVVSTVRRAQAGPALRDAESRGQHSMALSNMVDMSSCQDLSVVGRTKVHCVSLLDEVWSKLSAPNKRSQETMTW